MSSREWPLISKYRASVRTQPSKAEMIESLVKKNGNVDEGIIKCALIVIVDVAFIESCMKSGFKYICNIVDCRELLLDFYTSSNQRKPEHIIIFR